MPTIKNIQKLIKQQTISIKHINNDYCMAENDHNVFIDYFSKAIHRTKTD